ncbi:DUF308 domain-containing protein [Candidatus Saccharibacteria bacterium]|nr:DUF308 domain-containing protein [Candidatus Saccharibacteria bacterium]
MSKIQRKYIDSHWLVFGIEGVVALIFGWFVLFSNSQDATFLIATVSCMLLILGLIELFNVLHREHFRRTWGFSAVIAVFELITALALFTSLTQNPAIAMIILSVYALVRGVFEILIAARSIDDLTDRFIWLVCGICGIIFAFIVFNSGHFTPGTFVKFFGSYLMVIGLSNLIYGVHNRDQKEADRVARSASHKKSTPKVSKSQGRLTKKK